MSRNQSVLKSKLAAFQLDRAGRVYYTVADRILLLKKLKSFFYRINLFLDNNMKRYLT